ncbi:MAG: hypothetical protein K9J16_11485 [Melioribacteraceae bacterium]|nr:hypothetical protein [Melioribacteraceae bacterium]MCF8395192.1 hypothetical protein [Melioribacteraceae bacterium]MCF8420036.1 hypothetical protein [Melioribacteraceae bacterium]
MKKSNDGFQMCTTGNYQNSQPTRLLINKRGMIPKHFLIIIIFTFLILPVFTSISAQSNEITFEHLTPEMGLSQANVHCILQDNKGFLWFGTEDGLNRFDGYRFVIFRHNEKDTTSISDNFIWTLFEDSNNDLWIGTSSGGLNKFDREKEIFIRYQFDPENPASLSHNDVRAIYEDSKNNLWIGTDNGGLNKFNFTTKKFIRYQRKEIDPTSINHNSIRAIVEDAEGFLWIGTNGGGLNRMNVKTGEFKHYLSIAKDKSSLSSNFVWSLYRDNKNNIWVGTDTGGLNKLNSSTEDFTHYLHQADNQNSLVSANVTSIYQDALGLLWIGTEGGLSIFDIQKNKFTNVLNDPTRPSSLSKNFIRNILQDRSGIVWIGTVGGGINKYNRAKKEFIHYQHDPSNSNSLSNNMIRALFEDKNGYLWIGTLGGGLNRYDKIKGQYIHFKKAANSPGISDNRITSIYEDSKGFLWVGTWGGGLNRLRNYSGDKTSVTFDYYFFDENNPASLPSNAVQAIYEDSHDNLWVGTESGLALLNRSQNEFVAFTHSVGDENSLSDNRIQSKSIYEDRAGNLWIGTWKGLNRIESLKKFIPSDKSKIKFISYQRDDDPNSLSDNRIISIYEDPSSSKENVILWIGTVGGGLNKMSISNSGLPAEQIEFKHYTEKDGLPNNAIYGILGDNRGNLWLSTNNGLSKFDLNNETFRNYNEGDGLQSNQFYWGASYGGESGQMFFGGINGITAFYPAELKDNQHVPEVYITDLQLFNKSLPISDESPLKKSILETDEINLSYDDYVITFEFVALDYTVPKKNEYAYMLEGYDMDWIPAGNRRYVTYSGVGAGEYVFKVRGSNNDGVWNREGTEIKLNILPPYWMMWWFILLVFLTIAGLITYFIASYVRQLLAVERLRTKLAADLHDNIGASLTEISILSEVISKKIKNEDQNVQKSLKRISEDSRSLIDNMSDIVWLVNPKRDTLYDLILRLEDTYSELLSLTNISFTSKNLKSLDKISLSMEHRQHLFLIFKEGINNSINHSNCTEITMDAQVSGKNLLMILSDNGKGFEPGNEYKGNGLKNMVSRAEQIGGKLTITSGKDNGSRIEFRGKIS